MSRPECSVPSAVFDKLSEVNTDAQRSHEHPSWKARVSPWLSGLAWVYWMSAIGYVVYSDATDTGLMGHLFAFEVHRLGFANDVVNLILALIVVPFAPPVLLAGALGRWQTQDPARPDPPLSAQLVHAGVRHTLSVFKITLVLLVIGVAAALIHTRNLKVYDIDLSAVPPAAPPHAGFLALKAIPASRFQSSYFSAYPKGGSRVNAYRPLVGPGWVPNQPIHYFLHETSHDRSFAADWRGRTPAMEVSAADAHDAAEIASDFDPSQLKALQVKVAGRLPTIVAEDFEDKGFIVAADYVVVRPVHMQGHDVGVFDRYENFLVPALIVVGLPVALGVGGCMVWLMSTLWRVLRRPAASE